MIEIRNRFTGNLIASGQTWQEAIDNAPKTESGGADLYAANLSRAILTGANLTDANLTGANLSYAYLSCANLTGANLYNTLF